MLNDPSTTGRLRILQINLNKSEAAHLDIINKNLARNWDVICLQEPHLTRLGNIRTPNKFRQVYPQVKYGQQGNRVRSAIWVNQAMDTNNWEMVNIPGTGDITAIRIRGEFGSIAIFNVYNPCDSNTVQELLNKYLLERRGEFYGAED